MLAETTPTMFLADPHELDVYCHHDIHWQAFASVAELLEPHHKCNRLIGPAHKPLQNDVAVLVDHAGFQPFAHRSNYRKLIHVSHDLGDAAVYHSESARLSQFDLILVPGSLHFEAARCALPNIPIVQVGWPKLGVARSKPFPEIPKPAPRLNILYAPTNINTGEWRDLVPALVETGHNITIKNHIYWDYENHVPPPGGCEENYAVALENLKALDEFVKEHQFVNLHIASRRGNLCDLFPASDILITDASSSAAEFISFGPAVETGRVSADKGQAAPYLSRSCSGILFHPIDDLLIALKSDHAFLGSLLADHNSRQVREPNPFIAQTPIGAAAFSAKTIDAFLLVWDSQRPEEEKSRAKASTTSSAICKLKQAMGRAYRTLLRR